jgi:hypothetical protein
VIPGIVASGVHLSAYWGPELIIDAAAVWIADDIALADGASVSSWVDRIGGYDLAQATGAKQPTYRTTGIAGHPAVDFDQSDDMLVYTAASAVTTATSGHVFLVLRAVGVSGATRYVWSRADNQSTLVDRIVGAYNDLGFYFAQWASFPTIDEVQATTTPPVNGDDYLVEWASTGTAYDMRVNGTVQTLNIQQGSNNGDWFGDTPGRDHFVLGGLKHSGETGHTGADVAALIVVDGAISSDDRDNLYAWAERYGLSL